MSRPNVLVDLEIARRQRQKAIVTLFFGGVCIPTPEGPADAATAALDELGPIIEDAILAGAETIQVLYRGGNYDEARAAIAAFRTPTSARESGTHDQSCRKG